TATVGDTITYTKRVTNTGNISLTQLVAQDTPLGPIPLGKSSLAPGQGTKGILTYTVVEADLPGHLTNTLAVTTNSVSGKITATARPLVALASGDKVDQQMHFPVILKRL